MDNDNINAAALASLEVTGFSNAVRGTIFDPWTGPEEPEWRVRFVKDLGDAQALAAVWMDDPKPDPTQFNFEDPGGAFLDDEAFQGRSLRFRLQGMLTNIWSWATTYDS